MGEAWFLGAEREMYPQLLGHLDSLAPDEIDGPLEQIVSGYSAFGPMREWDEWYHYLLPRVLTRTRDGWAGQTLFELLVTGFMAIYPNGVRIAPYRNFREDTLRTIGQVMMDPSCWNGPQIVVGSILHRDNHNPNGVWNWWTASGDFSASMFFCLKYLPRDLVLGWMRSVLAIPSPHWRAQIIVWSIAAHDMLIGKEKWPSEWNVSAFTSPHWTWSHCLNADIAARETTAPERMTALLPDAAREDALHILRGHFSAGVYLEWLDSIATVDYLHAELGDLPSRFESLYVANA